MPHQFVQIVRALIFLAFWFSIGTSIGGFPIVCIATTAFEPHMKQHCRLFDLILLAVIATTLPAAATGTERDDTLLLSTTGGAAGDDASSEPSISADGRFVAFISAATNLHPDATTGTHQVLLSEPTTGSLTLVSRADGIDGSAANDDTWDAVASADGRYVAFSSMATNLHEDDPDTEWDVLVRDLETHQTILVSRASGTDGVKGNGECWALSISDDGRFVAFTSAADNLHADDPDAGEDVYVRDLLTSETILVSRASGLDGVKANGPSNRPSISADGRFVAFLSFGNNLHSDDPDTMGDVYVRDLQSAETMLVSRAGGADGNTANSPAFNPSISADGRYIAFDSQATNLHPDALDSTVRQVFVRDRETSDTVLVSRADGPSGSAADNMSFGATISTNGLFVGFQSRAGNLDPDVAGGNDNVYVRDLGGHETVLAGRASGATGEPANNSAGQASISADGRYLAFGSSATNLHADATDGQWQVYLRDVRGEVMIFADRFEEL